MMNHRKQIASDGEWGGGGENNLFLINIAVTESLWALLEIQSAEAKMF